MMGTLHWDCGFKIATLLIAPNLMSDYFGFIFRLIIFILHQLNSLGFSVAKTVLGLHIQCAQAIRIIKCTHQHNYFRIQYIDSIFAFLTIDLFALWDLAS